MLISHNWLKKYFDDGALPDSSAIIENTFTMGIFEVEGVENKIAGDLNDIIFDVKVLPDRAPYCYSHRYVAQELGALLGLSAKLPIYDIEKIKSQIDNSLTIDVKIEPVTIGGDQDTNKRLICPRYMARRVEGVSADASPKWLKQQLEVLGQRSINVLVDATNYIMLETGQPLHAFDADKVSGKIHVRPAYDGEVITLLDGTEVVLDSQVLIIADDDGALAIAGVKGGKKAEVTSDTKRIIIESANFDSVSIRKTSQKVGIKNESSKRYENRVTRERTALAMNAISELLADIFPNAKFGEIKDEYLEKPISVELSISVDFINNSLGLSEKLNADDVEKILNRVGILNAQKEGDTTSGEVVSFSAPEYRLDLEIGLDVVDEVGRIIGYKNLAPVALPEENNRPILKGLHFINSFKKVFKELGFSEIYTHSLKENGDVAVLNPLNIERGFMRNNISDSIASALENNLSHADLLGLDTIKIFESGKIFGNKNERFSFAFGIANLKKVKGYNFNEEVDKIFDEIIHHIGNFSDLTADKIKQISNVKEVAIGKGGINITGYICEMEIQDLINTLSDLGIKEDIYLGKPVDVKYKKYSQYPFMARDIAVFVPGEAVNADEVRKLIIENGGEDLVGLRLFDVFVKNKEGEPIKTSYAFRMVFQSDEKTLTDEDITPVVQKITQKMGEMVGWEVR